MYIHLVHPISRDNLYFMRTTFYLIKLSVNSDSIPTCLRYESYIERMVSLKYLKI